jgi:hypothetical protein
MKRRIKIRDKKIKILLEREGRENVRDDFYELLRRAIRSK